MEVGPGMEGELWLLLKVKWELRKTQCDPSLFQVKRLKSSGQQVMVAWNRGWAVEVASHS